MTKDDGRSPTGSSSSSNSNSGTSTTACHGGPCHGSVPRTKCKLPVPHDPYHPPLSGPEASGVGVGVGGVRRRLVRLRGLALVSTGWSVFVTYLLFFQRGPWALVMDCYHPDTHDVSSVSLSSLAATTPASSSNNKMPCFVTVQMAAHGDFLEAIQDMGQLGIRLPGFRYIVLTNDESLDAKDWEKVVVRLDRQRYTKVKTHVTYGKFLAWREPAVADHCRIVFVMDALNVPVNDASIWSDLEVRTRLSPGGLLAQLKPYNKTNLANLASLVQLKKDTQANVDRTKEWLLSRPDYRNDTLCHWTNFLAYDPTNDLFRAASTDFWSFYSTEMLTARDQPLWSYMVEKWQLRPSYLHSVPPHPLERRPHVHVCAERLRQVCQLVLLQQQQQQHITEDDEKQCRNLWKGKDGKDAGNNNNKEDASTTSTEQEEEEEDDPRHQHVLYNVTDPYRIDCTKKKGGHKLSALLTFA